MILVGDFILVNKIDLWRYLPGDQQKIIDINSPQRATFFRYRKIPRSTSSVSWATGDKVAYQNVIIFGRSG